MHACICYDNFQMMVFIMRGCIEILNQLRFNYAVTVDVSTMTAYNDA